MAIPRSVLKPRYPCHRCNEMMKREGFVFAHNVRFHSPEDKSANYPTLEQLFEEYKSRYGQENFRFERGATDKFGGKLAKEEYYGAVYVRNSHSLPFQDSIN